MGARRSGRRPAEGSERTLALPQVNAAVRLSAEDWPDVARSRVEDVGPQGLVVARPERAGTSRVSANVDDALLLAWTTDDAMYQVAVALTEVSEAQPPTWTLRATGPVNRQQRREAFRLEVRLSATLGTEGAAAAGLARVSDLSETGLRCTPPDGQAFARDDRLWVRLGLPDEEVTLDAKVVRVGSTGELGITFVRPSEAAADRIRKFLFSEQIARRARLAE